MTSSVILDTTPRQMVGMGQVVVTRSPAVLTAVLGSCVGVGLYCPRLRLGSLAHVVLPQSSGPPTSPAKFADQAIPYMIEHLERLEARRNYLIAKIAGGACMFGSNGPLQIGAANIEAVTRALAACGIRVSGDDTGGSKGRRVTLDLATGEMTVEIVGRPSRIL